jgi:hypothetical protein
LRKEIVQKFSAKENFKYMTTKEHHFEGGQLLEDNYFRVFWDMFFSETNDEIRKQLCMEIVEKYQVWADIMASKQAPYLRFGIHNREVQKGNIEKGLLSADAKHAITSAGIREQADSNALQEWMDFSTEGMRNARDRGNEGVSKYFSMMHAISMFFQKPLKQMFVEKGLSYPHTQSIDIGEGFESCPFFDFQYVFEQFGVDGLSHALAATMVVPQITHAEHIQTYISSILETMYEVLETH